MTWVQNCRPDCLSGADISVFTGYGQSQYVPLPNGSNPRVTLMWQQSQIGGIANQGAAIEFPRWVNWGGRMADMTHEWWTGRRLAHEFGHYAFWLLDQYDGPNTCTNDAYDVSIMNNDLAFSEIDSRDTPCAWLTARNGQSSWDTLLGLHYPDIPSRIGPPDPGPDDPGPLFNLILVNRGLF